MPSTLICQEMNWSDALPTLHLYLVPVPPLLRGVRGDLSLPGWWAVPTPAWVVRYGADYPKTGYEAKNNGKPAPNTPYATAIGGGQCQSKSMARKSI
ncbi:hypothetical protein [Moorena sp. SIO3A2]|uniref:hypothetical protein n=1 Tax=Moorena sp. SIO3A2 TaxID=2607841 RepID=UPI0013BE1BE1|nr:hypothetical protein [Moorena sp. SIO3A2]NER89857.1 hypothetical protein [Moorena sp. SIO3A2]